MADKTRLGVPFNNTVVRPTKEQRSAAMQGAQLTELVQSMYSIVLYDTETDSTVESPGLDPASRTNLAEYFFRVPPKTLEMSEPFTSNVQASQNGGKFVESYGSIIKSIRIAGTTGLRPNKSASPTAIPLLGVSDAQIATLLGSGINTSVRSIPADEKTGYDDIIFLRNIFRRYSDLKSSQELAGRVVMLWRNLKDADYWIVEPEDFRLIQNSSSPLTYEYNISFKTLSRFDYSYTIPEDPLEQSRSTQRLLARVQEYGQNISNIFLTISTKINRVQGYGTFVSNTVLAPMLNVINGLTAVRTSQYGVVRGLRTQIDTLSANAESAINQLARTYGLFVQIDDSTAFADPAAAAELISDNTELYEIIRQLRRTVVLCARIRRESIARESSTSDVNLLINRYAEAYDTPGTPLNPRRSPEGSPSYIGYESLTSAVGSAMVNEGEDLRDIANRLLGDPGRWRILAALNRLSAPYIAAVGAPGVLSPGDTLLYPLATAPGDNSSAVGNQNPSSNGSVGPFDAIVQAYGRDLLLKSEIVGDTELTDLVLGQDGDFATISGLANVEQAMKIKFMTSRGELRAHPKFGAKFGVGRKATPASFNELRINTINTLVSDSRVENIIDLRFVAVGDKLAVRAAIQLANSQDILQTDLALRRF